MIWDIEQLLLFGKTLCNNHFNRHNLSIKDHANYLSWTKCGRIGSTLKDGLSEKDQVAVTTLVTWNLKDCILKQLTFLGTKSWWGWSFNLKSLSLGLAQVLAPIPNLKQFEQIPLRVSLALWLSDNVVDRGKDTTLPTFVAAYISVVNIPLKTNRN